MQIAVSIDPQSGERITGRYNLQALRSHHPDKPSGFRVIRILGSGSLWITEYVIAYQSRSVYTVSIMEFEGVNVVHETQYFAEPFPSPAWRAKWVEQTKPNSGLQAPSEPQAGVRMTLSRL